MFDVEHVRGQFPALRRSVNGNSATFFDGPAGSQVPERVANAVSDYLLQANANCGAPFATSVESDRRLASAHAAMADFLGTPDPDSVAFGANMTSITLALSRAVARTWNAGDEIIVSRLDHDANVTPWTLAAQDRDVVVRHIDVRPDDCTLDLESFESALTRRTRLVAVGYASNAAGTINPVKQIASMAHDAGAIVAVDAVHYAPHGRIDVIDIDCDFLLCSAYKFFGPHVGVLYGRRELLETLQPYKLRPSPNDLPGRWMTGTQNHEGICGTAEAVEYLADLAGTTDDRAARLDQSFEQIRRYESNLALRLLDGLEEFRSLRVWGITDRDRMDQRVPTFSFTSTKHAPREIAAGLAARGIFVWSGNHYAYPLTDALQLEPDGTVRVGLLHYNTAAEVDRLLDCLGEFA